LSYGQVRWVVARRLWSVGVWSVAASRGGRGMLGSGKLRRGGLGVFGSGEVRFGTARRFRRVVVWRSVARCG